MWANRIGSLIILFMFFDSCDIFPQKILILNDSTSHYYAGKSSYLLIDTKADLNINDVAFGSASQKFNAADASETNFGHTKDIIWVRITVKNNDPNNSQWLINENYSIIDKVDFYIPSEENQFKKLTAGIALPMNQRIIKNRQIVFPFQLKYGEQKTFYLRFESQYALPINIQIWKPESFSRQAVYKYLVFGVFYGALIIMALYNLFLFFSVRDLSYLYYFLYAISLGYYQSCMDGLSYQFIFTNVFWFNMFFGASSVGFIKLFELAFIREFLQVKEYSTTFDRIFKAAILLCIAYILVLAPISLRTTILISSELFLVPSYLIIMCGIYCWIKGNSNAKIYLIATLIFLFGMFFRVLRVVGLENETLLTEDSMRLGVLLEMTILSFALGNRINIIKRNEEKEKALMRSRIASDLHDEIGSNLSSISLSSQMLKKSASLKENERMQLEEITATTRETADSIRDIIWFINPEHDKMDNLIAKMQDIASKQLYGIEYNFESGENIIIQSKDLQFRRNLFLIYKEILHNIAKHSKADNVIIKIQESKKEFTLLVTDNGLGFDEMKIDIKHGDGIKNIRSRAAEIGGLLNISSKPGNGTSILLRVKL